MRVDNKSIFDFQTITATRRPWDVLSSCHEANFVRLLDDDDDDLR